MIFNSRSNWLGTSALCALILAAGATAAMAQTALTVNGVDIDGSVVNTYAESRFQKPAGQMTPDERALVEQELTDIYLLTTQPSAEKFAEDPGIKAQIELQYRGTLAQAVARDYVESNPATEEEIFAEYEAELTRTPSLQYKARHILVESQATAQELITQLADGADFQELAKEHSTGPSGPQGGDLGWFAPNQMVAPFADAVAALEDGAFTAEPVQTQFGWHVILREESRPNEPPTLESMRDQIKQRVEQVKFQDYIDSLREAHSADS